MEHAIIYKIIMEIYNLDSKAIAQEHASCSEGKKELSLKQELQELLQLAQINEQIDRILYNVVLYDMDKMSSILVSTHWTVAVRNRLREMGFSAEIDKNENIFVSWSNRNPETISTINEYVSRRGLTQEELDMCYEELVQGFKEAAKKNSREATLQFLRYGKPEREWDLVKKQLKYRFKQEGLCIRISSYTKDGDSPETFVYPVTWED